MPRKTYDDEDDEKEERPKLQSLAQAARTNHLKQIRGTLFAIGILTIILNVIQALTLPGEIAKQNLAIGNPPGGPNPNTIALVVGYVLIGTFIFLGLIFILFGALVRSFPVPITIAALVLFTIPALACAIPNLLGGAIWLTVMNVFCIVALAKAVRTAFAYQREQRAELAPVEGDLNDGDDDA
jgi:hypothetical protein